MAYPLPACRHLHLALDTALWYGSVIAGTLKICCSLDGWYKAEGHVNNLTLESYVSLLVPTHTISCGTYRTRWITIYNLYLVTCFSISTWTITRNVNQNPEIRLLVLRPKTCSISLSTSFRIYFTFSVSSRKLHKNNQMSDKINLHICLILSVYKSCHQKVKYVCQRNHTLQFTRFNWVSN